MSTQKNHRFVKAEAKDLSTLRALLRDSELPNSDLTKRHLKHFFMVKSGNEVIGTVGLEIYGDCGLLRSLAVRQKNRGSGLGKKLVQKMESYASGLGMSEIYLLTTTAGRFFQYLGYEKVNRDEVPESVLQSEEFSQICPSSALSMKKAIHRCG